MGDQMYELYNSQRNMRSVGCEMGNPKIVGTPSNLDPEILAGE
jgi:hypothetical protein